jgi:hypothetical protein
VLCTGFSEDRLENWHLGQRTLYEALQSTIFPAGINHRMRERPPNRSRKIWGPGVRGRPRQPAMMADKARDYYDEQARKRQEATRIKAGQPPVVETVPPPQNKGENGKSRDRAGSSMTSRQRRGNFGGPPILLRKCCLNKKVKLGTKPARR